MTQFQNYLDEATVAFSSTINDELVSVIKNNSVQIGIAESMLGGIISHYLHLLPESNTFISGSVVCHSPRSFLGLCGVSAQSLRESPEELSQAMAFTISQKLNIPAGIATAGTVKETDNAVFSGEVFLGFAILGKKRVKRVSLNGSYSVIMNQIYQSGFVYLKHYLMHTYNQN